MRILKSRALAHRERLDQLALPVLQAAPPGLLDLKVQQVRRVQQVQLAQLVPQVLTRPFLVRLVQQVQLVLQVLHQQFQGRLDRLAQLVLRACRV